MPRKIDFTNPILGTRWLRSLRVTKKFGLRFEPNAEYKKNYLGFEFQANQFGLRGPDNIHSSTVISGTSYAMGMSVGKGKNWYELSNTFKQSFNIGMPVSLIEQQNTLEALFKGKKNTLVFIYHPNFWSIAKQFHLSRVNNKDIATFMSWKTSFFSLPTLMCSSALKKLKKRYRGDVIFKKEGQTKYKLDTLYAKLEVLKEHGSYKVETDAINTLFGNFDKVLVLRVPIKEQTYYKKTNEIQLLSLIQNYDVNWLQFKSTLKSNVSIFDLTKEDVFKMDDYLPFDTHWSEKGNRVFHDLLCEIIKNCA